MIIVIAAILVLIIFILLRQAKANKQISGWDENFRLDSKRQGMSDGLTLEVGERKLFEIQVETYSSVRKREVIKTKLRLTNKRLFSYNQLKDNTYWQLNNQGEGLYPTSVYLRDLVSIGECEHDGRKCICVVDYNLQKTESMYVFFPRTKSDANKIILKVRRQAQNVK